ncbi:MAG: hypothetical protein V4710_07670 [Verrucomicrobiota bacterium]
MNTRSLGFPGAALPAVILLTVCSLAQELNDPALSNAPALTAAPATQVATASQGQQTPAMLPAHFQATVFEVKSTPEQAASIDAKALALKGQTAETLLAALSEKGSARILYRIDQPVNAASERIQIAADEPVVTATRMMANGKAINTVSYQSVGVIISLSARDPKGEPASESPNISMTVELAALTLSEKEVAPGQKMPTTRKVALTHNGPLQFDQPAVILSISSASEDDKLAPLAYVIRYQFSAPAAK